MFTAALIGECDALLQEAERRAAAMGGDKVRRRVALARAGFRYTEAWARMRRHADEREWSAALSAGEEAIACAEDTAGGEPQAFWLPLAVRQTRAALAPYRAALTGP
jgi:hypothetical protein